MHYTLDEIRKIPILFIVGKGRSGTTLLSTILDSHPDVASATESRFLLILWKRYKNIKVWKPEMAEEFYQNTLIDLQVKRLWTFKKEFIEALKQLPPETKAGDLIKMVYLYRQSNFPKDRTKIIVDKNPMYTLFVDKIKFIYPEAKFYRLIRDPRDNVTSHIRLRNQPCGALAYKWKRFNLKLDKFSAMHPNDFFTQRFEDLILNKEVFFEHFHEYTGINSLSKLEEKRLDYKDQLEEKFDDRLKDQHQASVKPLDPKKIGHYKNALSNNQIQVIENICFPYATIHDYHAELPHASISLLNKLKWGLRDFGLSNLTKLIYNFPFVLLKNGSQLRERKTSNNN